MASEVTLTATISEGCDGPILWAECGDYSVGTEANADGPGAVLFMYRGTSDDAEFVQVMEESGRTVVYPTHAAAIADGADWLRVAGICVPADWSESEVA